MFEGGGGVGGVLKDWKGGGLIEWSFDVVCLDVEGFGIGNISWWLM